MRGYRVRSVIDNSAKTVEYLTTNYYKPIPSLIQFTLDSSKSMLKYGILKENILCTLIYCLLKDLHMA